MLIIYSIKLQYFIKILVYSYKFYHFIIINIIIDK